MIRLSYVLMGLLLLSAACKDSETQRTTPNGLKYTVIKNGDGIAPKKGEFLIFDFQLKDSKDSVWNESYGEIPMQMPIKDSSELKADDGIIQMLNQLTVGDSVKTSMTAAEFFSKYVRRPLPPKLDSSLVVSYIVNARDFMTEQELVPWREKITSERDEKQIKKYLADNNIKAQEDTSGIHYVIHNSSGAMKPTVQNCVDVNYTGRFLKTGQVFDSNRINFWLGQVIPGWQLALPMMGKGDSATFYIPSGLAYGPMGPQYGLPSDAILIFDVRLHNISEADPQTGACK
jgi:FKBP-type peptidyl-prolyl cis-trans isomerase FkpA